MAKGDSGETRDSLGVAGKSAQEDQNNLKYGVGNTPGNFMNQGQHPPAAGGLYGQNVNAQQNYNNAIATNSNDYNQIMGGYKDFSQNGGFSGQNIQDIRARSIDPIRSVYQNAQAGMDRQRSLQGGYSPNYMAASSQMARNLGQQVGDANTNVNAGIAQMQQQGRLAGMQGQAGMYGATPGMSNMMGNQLAMSNNNLLNLGQQGINASDMYLRNKLGQSQIPGDYQQALGNVGSTMGAVGKIATLGVAAGGG